MDLKYVIINFHDTNVSNILRFIGFFNKYGYEKYVRFSSSVRFELLKDKRTKSSKAYKMRIVFDGVEIEMEQCSGDRYCSYDEFKKYFVENLIDDDEFINQYCDGGMGDSYTNTLKYK